MRNLLKGYSLTASIAILVVVKTVYSPKISHAQVSANSKGAAMIHAGQDIFIQRCLQCHSANEGQVTFGPSLYGVMKKPHAKKSPAEIRQILKNGKGKMPSFDDKLTQQDTENLLAFIHTL
jgi:mono/diheme cytochrome c family protein